MCLATQYVQKLIYANDCSYPSLVFPVGARHGAGSLELSGVRSGQREERVPDALNGVFVGGDLVGHIANRHDFCVLGNLLRDHAGEAPRDR